MNDNIFKILFLTCFIAGCVIRAVFVFRVPHWWRNKQKIVHESITNLDKPLMILNFLGMQVIPFVYLFTRWLGFADYPFPVWARFLTGFTGARVFVISLWLLWRSHAELGDNFSPELQIKGDHLLVTSGVFQYIRHPMYAAHWLWAVAQALLLQNWIAGFSFLVSILPMYLLRVPREEKMMIENFGEEYCLYMARTGRIIPHIWKRRVFGNRKH